MILPAVILESERSRKGSDSVSVSGWMPSYASDVADARPSDNPCPSRSALQSTISLHEYDRVGSQTAANILSVEDNRVNRKYCFEVRRRSPPTCVTFSESLWQTATATPHTQTTHTEPNQPYCCVFSSEFAARHCHALGSMANQQLYRRVSVAAEVIRHNPRRYFLELRSHVVLL